MEDSRKKPIMIAVIVVCLGVAGAVTFLRSGGSDGGVNSLPDDKMTWVKCNNPDCKAEYEMSEKQFLIEMQKRINPAALQSTPAVVCQKCSKPSVYQAYKCGNPSCNTVFFSGSVPNDFPDRCPSCKRSETEESRKARKAGGQ